jgi:hypothetical protein
MISQPLTRFIALSLVLSTLSGCIVVPRTEMTQRIDFNYVTYPSQALSYNDIMCCAQCAA